jgi:hypothetical protein
MKRRTILALIAFLLVGLTTSADDKTKRPTIKKLGALDLLMVETTPVVFKDLPIAERKAE